MKSLTASITLTIISKFLEVDATNKIKNPEAKYQDKWRNYILISEDKDVQKNELFEYFKEKYDKLPLKDLINFASNTRSGSLQNQ